MILEINGKQVEVDNSFQTMTPEQQGAMVDDIASQIGAAPVAQPQTVAQPQATGGLLNMLDTPSAMPNATADLAPPQQDFGANTSSLFVDPATLNVPAQTPEQAIAGTEALKRDIHLDQDPEMRSVLYKLQQLAKAPTDLLGAPQDFMTMLVNGTINAANGIVSPMASLTDSTVGIDWRMPTDLPGSSDWLNVKKNEGIDSAANLLAQLTGNEPLREGESLAIPDEDVTSQDRVLGKALRFAGGGALGGSLLAGAEPVSGVKAILPNSSPYAQNASKAVMGDTLAGGGAGAVQGAWQEYAPESWKKNLGPIGDIISALVGGIGGGTVNSMGHSTVDAARNVVKDSDTLSPLFTDKSVPINPDTGAKFKPSQVDMAARIMQNMPSDIDKTVANLKAMPQDFAFAPPEARPTTGMVANDIGMALNENAARTKDPQRFLERDAARNDLASKKIDQSVPAGADPLDMTAEATRQYDDTINAARQNVDAAKLRQSTANTDITQQNADLTIARNRQNQSSEALSEAALAKRKVDTDTKNMLYREVPDDTPVDANSLYTELKAIEESVPRAARAGTEYASSAKRIGDLIYEKDPMTGNVTLKDLTYGDLNVVNNELKAARQEAVKGYRDVTHLDKLRDLVQGKLREMNPKAADYYANEFAPKWRTGRMGEYDRMLKGAVSTGGESSATRPSEMAGKFLKKPEDAKALQRAVDINGNPVTATNATEWMMGDLAKSNVLTENADLRYDKFKQWADKNKDVIDQFPAMRTRVDLELDRAARGGRLSKNLANDVKAAEAGLKTTEDELRRSALQHALDADPTSTISSIMKSKNPVKKMQDLAIRLSPDKKAREGLKASVRDWIKNEAETTAHIVGTEGGRKMSRAALDTLFKKHEKTLAAVYDPGEMNSLRQAHKLLDVAANLESKATAGSNTLDKFYAADKATVAGRYRMLEVALKAKYGVLAGGGKFRTLRLFFDALGSMNTKPKAVENALMEAHFNPELAAHLLTRNVKEIGTPSWNGKLNRLLAVASGARDDKLEEAP